ncbi:MAG: KH domain-containing protein [Calditrichaceae bacterium]|nr:KH domain-containing protein [Calditrichaceae bacterium]HES59780.1 KH domain-containing protein [Caldithrix sp.]
MLKEILEKLVRAIVDKPEEIHIIETKGQKVCIYELRVAKMDFGKVIGKHGKNALALRTILQSISAKSGMRVMLEIIE